MELKNALGPLLSWSNVGTAATAVSAVALMVLAGIANKLVYEMKKTREEEARPYVVIDLNYKSNTQDLYLIVKNVGRTCAYNIRFYSSPPIVGKSIVGNIERKYNIIEDRFGTNMPSMVPGWEYETLIDSISKFSDDEVFDVEVRYESVAGKDYKDTYFLKARPFKRIMWSTPSNDLGERLEQLVRNLEEMNYHLNSLVKLVKLYKE